MGVGIKVESLNAYFGKAQALHGITMDIAPNECTAIIGPSEIGRASCRERV